jgi:2-keto-4-pentenoate hydratase/2-oxohepta-3-ene-1,7-dioic acid hydratase in catechol pathway
MIFSVPVLLEFVSSIMTLEPGDIVSTGTPSGVGPLRAGQTVIVEVESIGRLINPVVDRSDRDPS